MNFFILILMTLTFSGCVGMGVMYSEKKITLEKNITKDKIVAFRGEPDKKIIEGNHEIWHYKKGFAWGGIVPVVIIPIPLVIPYWHQETVIQIENEQLISVESDETKSPIFMCSPIPVMWIIHGSTNIWCHQFESIK